MPPAAPTLKHSVLQDMPLLELHDCLRAASPFRFLQPHMGELKHKMATLLGSTFVFLTPSPQTSAAPSYNKPVAHPRLKDGVDKTTNHGPLLWSLAQNRASSQKYPSALDTDMRGPFQICSQPFKFLDKFYKQTSTDLDLIGVFKLHENKKQRGSRGATLHRQELHNLLNKHDKDSWEARDGELSCTCWALANA